jgi:hypothetical protein
MGVKTKSQNHDLFVCLWGTYPKYTFLLLLLKPKMSNQTGVTITYS